MADSRRRLQELEAGLSAAQSRAVALAESVADSNDAGAASRLLLEQTSASLLAHQERIERLASDLAERPARPELESRLARHPTLETMREFVNRQLTLVSLLGTSHVGKPLGTSKRLTNVGKRLCWPSGQQ